MIVLELFSSIGVVIALHVASNVSSCWPDLVVCVFPNYFTFYPSRSVFDIVIPVVFCEEPSSGLEIKSFIGV